MLKLERLNNCTFSQITNVWNSAFSNYSLNIQYSVEQISSMIGKKELIPSSSIVAFLDDRPVGFILNAIKTIDGVKMAWNGGTGVASDLQGKGVGKLLMEATMDIYKKESVEIATLEVMTDNAHGVKLYQKLGFEIDDTANTFWNKEWDKGLVRTHNDEQNYIVNLGYTTDVKELTFYNRKVAWESRWENIFNGHSLIIRDRQGTPLGYTLYKIYNDNHDRKSVIVFQLEVDNNIDIHEQVSITNILVTHVLNDVHEGRTGDFVSKNQVVHRVFEEFGFKKTVDRYLMNKRF